MIEVLSIEHIDVGERHRKYLGDIDALVASIKQVGLLNPLTVTPDHKLVAGKRRLEAVKKLKWTEVPVHVVSGLDDALQALRAERDENECRKPFTPSEAVRIGKVLKDLEREQARLRQQEAGARGHEGGRGREKPPGAICAEGSGGRNGRSAKKVAEAVGMKESSFVKAEKVVDAAEANPKEQGDLVEEMDRTAKIDPVYRKLKQRKQAQTNPATEQSTGLPACKGVANRKAMQLPNGCPDKQVCVPSGDKVEVLWELVRRLNQDLVAGGAGDFIPAPERANAAHAAEILQELRPLHEALALAVAELSAMAQDLPLRLEPLPEHSRCLAALLISARLGMAHRDETNAATAIGEAIKVLLAGNLELLQGVTKLFSLLPQAAKGN
jgi:ParB family chromosome partitioning protein